MKHRGSCLCRGVVFDVDEFGGAAGHCHCSMCRKFHGAAYATLVGVQRNAFHWVAGQALVRSFEAPNGTVRSFCRVCGSSLFFASPEASPDLVEIALGLFEADVPVEADAHIFRGSAAGWVKICDGLPQYLEGRRSEKVLPPGP